MVTMLDGRGKGKNQAVEGTRIMLDTQVPLAANAFMSPATVLGEGMLRTPFVMQRMVNR